jgi:hypothetical protein
LKSKKAEMSNINRTGTILIRNGTSLPPLLKLETESLLPDWNAVKKLDGYGLGRKLHQLTWNFFYLAGEIRMTVVGRSGDGAVCKAVERILAGLRGRKFNSLEITRVVSKRFLGMPYVKVFAHSRHIQEGLYLAPARDSFLKTPAATPAAEFGPGSSKQELQSNSGTKPHGAAILSS